MVGEPAAEPQVDARIAIGEHVLAREVSAPDDEQHAADERRASGSRGPGRKRCLETIARRDRHQQPGCDDRGGDRRDRRMQDTGHRQRKRRERIREHDAQRDLDRYRQPGRKTTTIVERPIVDRAGAPGARNGYRWRTASAHAVAGYGKCAPECARRLPRRATRRRAAGQAAAVTATIATLLAT